MNKVSVIERIMWSSGLMALIVIGFEVSAKQDLIKEYPIKITTPSQDWGAMGDIYYTKEYTKKDGCVSFDDVSGFKYTLCEEVTIKEKK